MARKRADPTKNHLYYGDNLDVLRESIPDESVDLIYLDPPFNSNRAYSVLFKEKSGDDSQAQLEAFDDTWTWAQESEELYTELITASTTPNRVKDALVAMRRLLGDNDVLAYIVMITARLLLLHRALKDGGSLYLHCDPTASHYLKIVLDSIFGAERFQSEIIWKRTGSHGSAKRYGPVHDVLLFYSKSEAFTWNQVYGPYDPSYIEEKFGKSDERGNFQDISLTGPEVRSGESGRPWRSFDPTARGRHWALPGFLTDQGLIPSNGTVQDRLDALDEAGRIYWTSKGTPRLKFYVQDGKGMPLADVWTDVGAINSQAAERLGYPTQKPLALLERIVAASTNEGDVVLDPFCGCGTTIDAAQRLGRRWIGIDITTLAIDLIDARLRHSYGEEIQDAYEILGIPRDLAGAEALFKFSPFEFERWCVMQLDGQPNDKQVGDKGVDGVIRFPTDGKGGSERILVSVKGGATNPGHVRDLVGTVNSQRAGMGVFVTMREPTKGMLEAANQSGIYHHPANGQPFPKVQIITVRELLDGNRPKMPMALLPYFQAQKHSAAGQAETLF